MVDIHFNAFDLIDPVYTGVKSGLSCDRSGVESGLSCDRTGVGEVRVKL